MKKLQEIDLVRGIAILAVVFIHASAGAVGGLPEGTPWHSFFFTANQLMLFAVPVFLFISGLVLAYRYKGRWDGREMLKFYRKRLTQIMIPFLVWSAVFYAYFYIVPRLVQPSQIPGHWWSLLPWGQSSYHLYYLSIIIQFYLLFPILMELLKRFPKLNAALVPIGAAAQIAFYLANEHWGPFEHKPTIVFNYMFVLLTGCWIGWNYERWRSLHRKLGAPVVLFAVAAGGAFLVRVWTTGKVNWPALTYDTTFHLYGLAAALLFLWLGAAVQSRRDRKPLRLLALIGQASFGIYLVHPLVLSMWDTYTKSAGLHAMNKAVLLGGFVVTVAVSLALSLGYSRAAIEWRGTRPASGDVPQSPSGPGKALGA
ncbi:acyltransferase [Paenibacillus thermoaerophilus]|uniref:Acyltransferase n=1 Tax=Paenibacillus thermoaerophilus TaxID=1215385 RepID=A0ABW2V8B7_9BACL|nr:acyltransferase [Paenibacillus thermoaerophilus]